MCPLCFKWRRFLCRGLGLSRVWHAPSNACHGIRRSRDLGRFGLWTHRHAVICDAFQAKPLPRNLLEGSLNIALGLIGTLPPKVSRVEADGKLIAIDLAEDRLREEKGKLLLQLTPNLFGVVRRATRRLGCSFWFGTS